MTHAYSRFAILGAGSWGSAIAMHLARCGHKVFLWGNIAKQIDEMLSTRENSAYLPGFKLPPAITPTYDLTEAVTNADEIGIAVPSHAFKEVFSAIKPSPERIFWLTKGLDPDTNLPFSHYIMEKRGKDYPCAIFSGPSFAKEVAQGLPTALTLASNNISYQHSLMQAFHQGSMRIYLSEDMLGVQLCGAIKNVLAIACGISDGLGYGANARSAIITRGLNEMKRLGMAMHGLEQTFYGLAGVGDLILTCTDNLSRNRRFGIEVGKGRSIAESIKSVGQVVEGQQNAKQIISLAKLHQITMPICEAVLDVINQHISPREAGNKLMSRVPAW
ncbi:MAG: glycerol-3-phosphate dehydrogenase [Legionellales bacterium RIFCSPHIGHO2_12_FULL_37_14]|nr:MAG: glycerol-3-phosphate dehydrogenase [Legionellales bacterium RIFCSPHIGHO2_12_FULL_37_14]